jgi:hypothetical protein
VRRAARVITSRRFAPGSGAEKALESRPGAYPPPAIQDEQGEHREHDIPQRIPRPAGGALATWEDAAPTTTAVLLTSGEWWRGNGHSARVGNLAIGREIVIPPRPVDQVELNAIR